jgi:Cdc6-like AAA superfamily ATPase
VFRVLIAFLFREVIVREKILHALAKFTLETFSSIIVGSRSIREFFITPQLKTADGNFVSVEALFEFYPRVIVVGSAGVGKTTLLRFFSNQQAAKFEAHEETACPVFINGRELSGIHSLEELLEKVSDLILERTTIQIEPDEIRQYFLSGRLSLIVDGLDEISDTLNRNKVTYILSDFSRYFPYTNILLSSRPSNLTISFSGFSYLYLSSFGSEQVSQLIFALSEGDRNRGEKFLSALSENDSLKALAVTPLLIGLLWNVFQVRGYIPQTSAFLYSDFTDYLLSNWDTQRETRPKTLLTLDSKHRLLEEIAVHQFEQGVFVVGVEEISEIIAKALRELHIDENEEPNVLNELLSRGVLVEVAAGTIQFVHLSFLEYYVAKALVRTPQKLIALVSRPNAHQVLIFACGLIADVAPIIEAAIESGKVILAAKCLSHGRTDNKQLAEYVAQEFIREVGEPFTNLLKRVLDGRVVAAEKEDIYSILLQKWDRFSQDDLPSHIKGSRFEEFVIDFFSQMFTVVSHDLNTENGELDIIVEIIKQDSFWMEFGGDAFVECKNWASHIPLKDVGAFIAKVNQGRVKLAFFVSVNGFTSDAEQRLRIQASNISAPLIVPIEGADLKEVLLKREYFEEFFKRKIREIKYLRKY